MIWTIKRFEYGPGSGHHANNMGVTQKAYLKAWERLFYPSARPVEKVGRSDQESVGVIESTMFTDPGEADPDPTYEKQSGTGSDLTRFSLFIQHKWE